jgi:trimeric autotransporter adhesin
MLMAVLGLSAVSAFGLMAYAYWSGNDTASSSFAKADVLGKGATPNVTTPASPLVASSVGVSWAKSFLDSEADVGGYIVKRYPDPSGSAVTVGAGCSGTITALNCSELNVPDGTWTYTVTPVIGTNWVGTESNKSSSISVGTTKLAITSSPVSIVAGSTSSSITVERRDAGNNPTSVGSRTVTLVSTSGAGTFRDSGTPATVITSVIIPDGASSITFKYNDTIAGTPTITASSSNVTSATQLVTVTSAAANKLSFTTSPANGTAGNDLAPQPVVTIQDQYGNTATTATNSVSLTGATFAATPSTCTPTLASGVVTFSGCRINTAGSYTLVAGSSPSLTTASSTSFTISAATATQLVYGTQPSSAIAGAHSPM